MTAESPVTLQNTKEPAPNLQSSGDLFDSTYDTIARRALELFEGHGRRAGHDELRSIEAAVSSQRTPDSERPAQAR